MPTPNINALPVAGAHIKEAAAHVARYLEQNPADIDALDPFWRSVLAAGGHRGRIELAEREAAKLRRERREQDRARRIASGEKPREVTLVAGRAIGLY